MPSDPQLPLFPTGALTDDASIQAALGAFEHYMETKEEPFALNTRKAFASDIRLLGKYLGIGQPIGQIGTRNLKDFLDWLRYERGVPCSNKSYARRVTTLKTFFAWLHESGVLATDPAKEIIQITVSSPLPSVPSQAELEKALEVTFRLRQGGEGQKADARPHLLLTLLLQTGIKKGEAMTVVPNHIVRDGPGSPFLFIRYADPRLRKYKERKVALDPGWLDVLDEYLAQYEPSDTLFTCTARNLEYILTDVGEAAGLEQGMLSFENLRWVSAMRDYRNEMEPSDVRRKLGLAPVTWRETKSKIERLLERERFAQMAGSS